MPDVLVVDDEPTIRELLVLSLTAEGFNVRHARDGEEALALLAAEPPDCMVLDVMMPGLDGFGVLRAMRERQLARSTRVIMLTCRGEDRDYVRGFDLGAHDYVTKPFDPEKLLARLHSLLEDEAPTLEFKRRQELQRAMLLDRLQTTFARQASRGVSATPTAPSEPAPAAETSTALPLRWRLG